MAKSTVTCTCATCGKTFERETICHNRTEADNWTKWAEANMDECTSCWKKRKLAENAEWIEQYRSKLTLPTLTGTEKQIKYATSLINLYFLRNKLASEIFIKELSFSRIKLTDPDLIAACEAKGITKQQAAENYFFSIGYRTYYRLTTESSSANVIDLLKFDV